ncbi:MAG: right-handed parallel beta-helix repeat-containing protein [Deltaproteobacteria bacterium]|nr:right-handed parallel beta-helix repeat-containing protein [Deltaproteobacteria bacterium]
MNVKDPLLWGCLSSICLAACLAACLAGCGGRLSGDEPDGATPSTADGAAPHWGDAGDAQGAPDAHPAPDAGARPDAQSPPLPANPAFLTRLVLTASKNSMTQGEAVHFRPRFEGERGYDPTLRWQLSPPHSGTVSDTGIYLPAETFAGTATITATSTFNPASSAQAIVTVVAGDKGIYVDAGVTAGGNGSRAAPFRTLQQAVDAVPAGTVAATIKVARGTYSDPVAIGGRSVLVLGGFARGFGQRDAAVHPSHIRGARPAGSQEPSCDSSAAHAEERTGITIGGWDVPTPSAASGSVVDGFTISHWRKGVLVDLVNDVQISGNTVEYNGTPSGGDLFRGAGISVGKASGNWILKNILRKNLATRAGALQVLAGDNGGSHVHDNDIVDNLACGDHGGAVFIAGGVGQPPHRFTRNRVRRNRLGEGWGWGGGLLTSAAHLVMAYDIFSENEAPSAGSAMILDDPGFTILDHELIWGNIGSSRYREGGGAVYLDEAGNVARMYDCVVVDNEVPDASALFVDKSEMHAFGIIAVSGGKSVNVNAGTFVSSDSLFGDAPPGQSTRPLVGDPAQTCGAASEPAALHDACALYLAYLRGERR